MCLKMHSTDYFYGMSIFYAFSLKFQSNEVRIMKKKKGEITKYFDLNRSHYTDKDGNYVYTYQQLQDDGTYADVKTVIELTDETINIIRVLQESNRQMDLQDTYQRWNEDKLIKNTKIENEDGIEYKTIPLENIPDKKNGYIQDFI